MSYGMDARIGISFQNSYGTSNVASLHWLEPTGESIDLKKEQIVQEGLRGIYDEGRHQEGKNTVDGDITIEAKPLSIGVFLEAIMVKASTVTSGSVITHTYRPRTSDHSQYSAERAFTLMKYMGDTNGSAHLYSDLNGANLELSISNGELLTAKLGVVGGTYSQSAAVAASYSAGDALDWAISSLSLGGTAKTNVRDLSITLDNAIEAQHNMGATTKYPSRIKRTGFRSMEIGGTVIFDDQTDYQNFVSQAEQRFLVHLRGRTEIQSGYYESLTIDVPSLRFTEFPQAVGGPGQIEVSFSAKAVYNTGSGNIGTFTLVNTRTGY